MAETTKPMTNVAVRPRKMWAVAKGEKILFVCSGQRWELVNIADLEEGERLIRVVVTPVKAAAKGRKRRRHG